MKKLLKYLTEYRKESILAPIFKMLEACFELIVPLVVAAIVDNGIKNADLPYIYKNSIVLIVLAIVGLIASITAQYFAAKAATGFSANLRTALFEKINTFGFAQIDSIGTSTLITRITNDVNRLQNGVNLVLRLFLRSPVVVIGATIMALSINVKVGSIFIFTIILLSVVIAFIMKVTVPKYKSVQKDLDSLTLNTRENLSGARVIRAFCDEKTEYNNFNSINCQLTREQKQVGSISALLNPLTSVIINLAIIFLIYSGAIKVNDSILTQGMVVALYNYMCQILIELIKFANLIVSITKAFASATRVNEIFDIENSTEYLDDSNVYNDNAIRFDNVSFKYPTSSVESISNISFFIDKGQILGIIGSTGSGKTSIVNLINRFYDATSGLITINGKNIKSYTKKDLNSVVKTVMQQAVLFSESVRDNIKWGKKDATDEEIDDAIKKAQIYNEVYNKNGLDTKIASNASNLSGGQRQRLSIARAIVAKPEIIILDDSTSALDYATEKALVNSITNLEYKPTMVIVSQRCSTVINADKIIVMDDGHCVGIGSHKELLSNNEVYREIYYSQYEKEDINE